MFVVFEGIEGSGKSTQAKAFYDTLTAMGEKCIMTKEPSESDIEKLIRKQLAKKRRRIDIRTSQLLFIADRSYHVENVIKPALEKGYTVICDRYSPTTIAYGAAFGEKYNINLDWLINVNAVFPRPNFIFYFDISPDVAYDRIRRRKEENANNPRELKKLNKTYETLSDKSTILDRIKKLSDTYKELSKHYSKEWCTIDGNRSKAEITEELLQTWHKISE